MDYNSIISQTETEQKKKELEYKINGVPCFQYRDSTIFMAQTNYECDMHVCMCTQIN